MKEVNHTGKDKYEYLKYMNDRIYEQLTYAETKHAVLLGLVGIAVFALIGIIIDINDCNLVWLQIILGIKVCSNLIAMLVSLSSFYPNVKSLNKEKFNLFFYGDIAELKNGENYIEEIEKTSDSDLQKRIAEQNIYVSKMITTKHNKFKIALNLIIASVILPYYIILLIIMMCKCLKNSKER